jgi:hypothetical protein
VGGPALLPHVTHPAAKREPQAIAGTSTISGNQYHSTFKYYNRQTFIKIGTENHSALFYDVVMKNTEVQE